MRAFGQFVGRLAAVVALVMTVSTAWASEFRDKAERIFSPSVIESVKESAAAGTIAFKVPERMPDYFETGDKANKVFAIESARLFRDDPSLRRLILQVPHGGALKVLNISRADIQRYYGVDFGAMNGNPNVWREEFIQRYDTSESRADFVKHFVSKR